MSLESEIKNLTAAVTRLAEGVEKLLSISQPSAAPNFSPKIERIATEVLDAAAKQELATQAPALEQTAEPSNAAAPTFDDAKKAFLAIAQKFGAVDGTAKSRDVLSRFGVPNLKALPVEQYPDFIELCNTAVAGGGV